jgi:hypothetical protein
VADIIQGAGPKGGRKRVLADEKKKRAQS